MYEHQLINRVKAVKHRQQVDTRLQDPNRALGIGTKIRLIPGHCDPTVNLYDWFVCYRNDRVEALWPITARGAVC